jgi:predicted DNA-binding protein
MPSSARLDKETEALLKKAAEQAGVTKSQLVRESIREYCTRIVEEQKRTAWEIYESVHAPGGSGHGKRVAGSKQILKKKFEAMRKTWSS